MKLLIAVDKTRFLYLQRFSTELKKKGIESLVVDDLDIYDNSKFNKKYLRWTKTPEKISKIINEFKPDLVLTERVSHFSSYIIKKKIPLIIFLRGDYWKEVDTEKNNLKGLDRKKVENYLKQNIAEKCFRESTLILPICEYLKDVVEKRYPEKLVSVLYQGIEFSEWYYEKGVELKHPCVGFVQDANIWEKTKQMELLPHIMEKLPHVNFYWAGDGRYAPSILKLLEKYENFHWLKRLDYPIGVRKFFSEIDIYGLLSGIDMSPHTILEAGLMKKPIIATNVGGISESCKDEETGFLVSKDDSNDWIKKIKILLENKEMRESMGNAGFRNIKENFLWEKIVDDFIDILKEKKLFT